MTIYRELVSLANELDQRGLVREADTVDSLVIKAASFIPEKVEPFSVKIIGGRFEGGSGMVTDKYDDGVYGIDLDEPMHGSDRGFASEEQVEEIAPKAEGAAAIAADDASSLVRAAIKRTQGMPHFEKTFLTRNPGPDSEGSIFSEPQTAETLMAAEWTSFDHPEIKSPAKGYSAKIPGRLGLVKLSDLDPDTPVRMEQGHKGEDEYVTALIDSSYTSPEALDVSFTVILLGPSDDGDIVWTFFPGDPVAPSVMTPSEETKSAQTAQDAIDLGFDYGKITGDR
mgnify:CR=1 FL=1|tara:strand:- start:292 stop:1140 length:849 start_codon:yes stop_codon:yes gene_type:complete